MATVNEKMTAIADAIRGKTGATESLTLDDMATEIPEVYEAGKDEINKAWWATQIQGSTINPKTDWQYAFYCCDLSFIGGFNPYETIRPKQATSMFHSARNIGTITKNMLNTSNITSASKMFYQVRGGVEIEELDFRKLTDLNQIFYNARDIRIGKLILKEDGTQTFTSTFFSTAYIEIDAIEGVIGKSIAFTYNSTLTREGMVGKPATTEQIETGKNLFTVNGAVYYGGLFGALKNFVKEGLGNTATISLPETPKGLLTDEEISVVTETLGWTIA